MPGNLRKMLQISEHQELLNALAQAQKWLGVQAFVQVLLSAPDSFDAWPSISCTPDISAAYIAHSCSCCCFLLIRHVSCTALFWLQSARHYNAFCSWRACMVTAMKADTSLASAQAATESHGHLKDNLPPDAAEEGLGFMVNQLFESVSCIFKHCGKGFAR